MREIMAKTKFYAVRKGSVIGIFTAWSECESAVKGFSGAQYKSFPTKQEAEAYLKGETQENIKISEKKATKSVTVAEPRTKFVAYVDGSYNSAENLYGIGGVMTENGEVIETYSAGSSDECATMRNVAGEIQGAMWAMKWAMEHDVEEITIGYDYTGIECWAKGRWKTNNPHTKAYAAFYKEASQRLNVHFLKIAAHTGHIFNEMADELAKKGANVPV